METAHQPENDFHFLSELVLTDFDSPASANRIAEIVRDMNPDKFEAILELAAKNHVVIRAFSRLSEASESDWQGGPRGADIACDRGRKFSHPPSAWIPRSHLHHS